jgi:hypothetical protein
MNYLETLGPIARQRGVSIHARNETDAADALIKQLIAHFSGRPRQELATDTFVGEFNFDHLALGLNSFAM